MRTSFTSRLVTLAAMGLLLAGSDSLAQARNQASTQACDFNDSHFHLTNYIQEGPPVADVAKLMGSRVCRSTLFGIPLQQMYSYQLSGDFVPTYYLDTDAPLYYYSLVDAMIAKAYLDLPEKDRARWDPMITGFNPADMYAADQIKRVLKLYPGVFTGIGEFSIHKEFVSSKIAGGGASLTDRALDKVLDFAGEAGLLVIMHNDIAMPFAKDEKTRPYFQQLKDVFLRHPKTTIIWAHMGLGRVIHPIGDQVAYMEEILSDPKLSNVYFDISWDEVAKYLTATPETPARVAAFMNKYPDRFLFGTDVVAPRTTEQYFHVYDMYAPLWQRLTPETSEKIRRGNYQRLFDAARVKVRAWEKANVR
jgi:predicted TIM-barrel fold metal-dependent hydrolase